MTFWQYNAYSEGYILQQKDALALQVQAAYYEAYWNGEAKHKKSLEEILRRIYKDTEKPKKSKPMDVKALEQEFALMEELRKYATTK